ncbi:MAG: ROK family transcriptional regulator [Lachnospiraceae bacterium]|jgi:transcriptional regulator of PTS gene|nr:ROK family transcriptional regulator [Lachnospiraceae bacterium]
MISQQLIKSANKKELYTMISENPGISRAQLASLRKLSKTTVSALVEELIQEGYIIDEGAVESRSQGRRPNSLVINDQRDCIVVLNWRKRMIQTALVSASFEVELVEEAGPVPLQTPAEMIRDLIHDFAERHGKGRHILGICLIVPGIVDSERKRVISMVLPLEEDNRILADLRQEIDNCYPLSVFNDTACFAYAENVFGDVDINNYAYLNISEGVGASLIQNGTILMGATGMGTQFGHFSIDRNGALCSCGNRGCLENRIGEMALRKRAEERGALMEFEGVEQILFKDVAQLAGEGKPGASALLCDLADDLSFALGNLITMFHPDTIIIGGMGRKLGEAYLSRIRRNLGAVGFRKFVEDVDIRFTRLKEDAIFRGAAKYYLDTHYNFMEEMRGKLFLY